MTLSSSPASFGKLNVGAMVRKLLDDNAPILTLNGPPVDGVGGTYADYPVGKGALLIDVMSGVLYINTGSVGDPAWSEIPSHSSGPGLGVLRTAKGTFDATIDNATVGTHNFVDRTSEQDDIAIPAGSIVVFGIIDTTIAFVGSGGTPTLGLSLNGSVTQAATSIGVAPWTLAIANASNISDWLATSYLKMTNGLLQYTIGGEPLTAGEFDIHYFYIDETE